MRTWFDARAYAVERVTADASGGLVLRLADDFALDVFPDRSGDDEYSEHWRMLRPADLSSHFVVTAQGIER